MFRAQGLPQHICVLQDLSVIPNKQKNEVKKLFKRYFESELNPDKIFNLQNDKQSNLLEDKDEIKSMIRLLCSVSHFAVNLN